MSPTEEYIRVLQQLNKGELGLLRTHVGQGLDESVQGFDLFAGIWWPLREKNQRAPKRDAAWLVAKLYATCPLEHRAGWTIVRELRKCRPNQSPNKERFEQRLDRMLTLELRNIESVLRWALGKIDSNGSPGVDWVALTDDLSKWDRQETRLKWAEQYLQPTEGTS